ncbi:actin-related protein 2/3 complex subunit 2B-like [Pyrus communis]|uniref:actin-related protein 2/3 complex subunit 2B-like n=1 Tax=Pyrus communis TaxID=23211 RepID=UPI0035C2007B
MGVLGEGIASLEGNPAQTTPYCCFHNSDNKSIEIDHHLYEFGSVEYHIQSSASDTHYIYSSVSIPLLSQGVMLPYGISHNTKQMVKGIRPDVVEIIEPAKEGYQLTLRLDFSKISNGKDSAKVIAEIAAVQAVIVSSQLKEMLTNVNSQDTSQGMNLWMLEVLKNGGKRHLVADHPFQLQI